MDEIFKKVLNDRDIFWIKKEIFNETEWSTLKQLKDNPEEFIKIVDIKIKSLENEIEIVKSKIKSSVDNKDNKMKNRAEEDKKDLEKSIELCKRLKSALENSPNILDQMLNTLKSYGVVVSNLPNMDDYGKVIERYGISTIELFFFDKIKKENNIHRRKALKKVLDYVKELYNSNRSSLEIAYFVRKIDQLTIFWEVL